MLTQSSQPISELWTTVYNGSDKIWIISNLTLNEFYIFRVAAVNNYGVSEHSVMDEAYLLPALTGMFFSNLSSAISDLCSCRFEQIRACPWIFPAVR